MNTDMLSVRTFFKVSRLRYFQRLIPVAAKRSAAVLCVSAACSFRDVSAVSTIGLRGFDGPFLLYFLSKLRIKHQTAHLGVFGELKKLCFKIH
jgi:hypothetical protein